MLWLYPGIFKPQNNTWLGWEKHACFVFKYMFWSPQGLVKVSSIVSLQMLKHCGPLSDELVSDFWLLSPCCLKLRITTVPSTFRHEHQLINMYCARGWRPATKPPDSYNYYFLIIINYYFFNNNLIWYFHMRWVIFLCISSHFVQLFNADKNRM